ncbi:MAG: dihydroorotate dehydrogenase electron transfer subunit [Clostridiales bacterium]|nr:dihydroorotate dehydrogenase electron transfer subunit [Clostridiales bacterium]MDK2932411.1 dihydroorotate dehydrogenase electron transfer subunit [Clostridiales bacterium]
MYKQNYLSKISYKKEIVPGIFDMRVVCKEIAQQAKPGQFLNIKCCEGLTAILRRPISICDIDTKNQEIRFIFQVKGNGTKLLALKKVGDNIDILGPLGNGYYINDQYTNPLLVGGGIGVFPLLMLIKSISSQNSTVYLGFKNKEMVVLEKDFHKVCSNLQIATDDGSYGHKGYVTQLMEKKLQKDPVDIVYACGPEPMLRLVNNTCKKYNIPCQISLEQRMGCGIGACLVCACKIKTTQDWEYKHVCKDGPVFWGNEVIFDD